jgi:very-short-patch-repair endonuclease
MRATLGPEPVLVGPSAAFALGCPVTISRSRVHVAGVRPRRTAGLVAHRLVPAPDDVWPTAWGRATCPEVTMVDIARGIGTDHLSIDERVAWVDHLAHRSEVSVRYARELAAAWRGRRGLPAAREVLALARDGAESVKETELRLLVGRRGFAEPTLQHEVRSVTGRFVARLDLSWPDHRVGVEYDGRHHRDQRTHSRDLARHNALRAEGWVVLQVDAAGLRSPETWIPQLWTLLA